jgi:hypothetical protein
MIAIAIASYLCIQYCYENDFDSDDVLSFVILPLSILQITMFGLIGNNIEAVSGESDTKNFKIVLSICGGLSAIPVFYSLYKIIKFLFPTAEEKEKRAKKEALRKIRQANAHRFQEQKDIKEENEQHRAQLELQQVELQRQNDLVIEQARKEINDRNTLAQKRRVEETANKLLADQKLEEQKLYDKLESEKNNRQFDIDIYRDKRTEDLREITTTVNKTIEIRDSEGVVDISIITSSFIQIQRQLLYS